jgi:tight adherence protein C
VTAVVITFAGLGTSLFLLGYLLFPRRAGLVVAVGRFDASRVDRGRTRGSDLVPTARGWMQRRQLRLGERLAEALAARGVAMRPTRQNLELLDRSYELFIGRKVTAALAGFLLVPAAIAALARAGIGLAPAPAALAALTLAGAFWWLPDWELHRDATRRREELRHALGAFLDWVGMSMAGGRGVPEALPTAASIGSGWAFNLLADTIAAARRAGVTPWQALGELGERAAVQELRDLAGSLTLVADDGARIRDSLSARARTLRARKLADAEGHAGVADQKMNIAQLVMAFGFVTFITYPAVYNVLLF